ncbi:MAG TPA: hypothetical protein VFY17_04880, partial [Pilimelia sp.]|nr:hypothetical protein [Pilimelia sp.]
MTVPLPNLLPVRTMLADLLDRDVEVAGGTPFTSEDLPSTAVALYTDDPGRMVALLGLDLAMAAYCGAALGLLPVGAAEAALADGRLSAALRENVSELCNV